MLSARSVFEEILDSDDAFRLFCSIAAAGEAQGGWENAQIAAMLPVSLLDLGPKVTRHGADEAKHGRIFNALLRKRGLTACVVSGETNYTALLEARGIGVAHRDLRRGGCLSEQDVIAYLAHSRVTEQRAAEQMAMLVRHFGDRLDIGRAVRVIAADEDRHLAYCHEELLRLISAGHRTTVRRLLRACARAETDVYRDVSLAMSEQLAAILRWSRIKRAVITTGVHIVHAYDRTLGRGRFVSLAPPPQPDPLGPQYPRARSSGVRTARTS
jgi:hypothetical protein